MKQLISVFLCIAFVTCLKAQKTDSLLQVLKKTNLKDSTRILTIVELAIAYRNIKTDTSLILAQKALKLSEKIDYSRGIGLAYQVMGIYFLIKNDYEKSLRYYLKAFSNLKRAGTPRELAWIYQNIGTVYRNQGHYDKALECYFKSLKVFEAIKDTHGMGWVYGNLGLIYTNQGSLEKALEYHQKSLKIRQETGSKPDIAFAYSNIGEIYRSLQNYTKALKYLEESLKIYEIIQDKLNMAIAYTALANIYIEIGQYPKSLAFLEKSQKIAGELKNKGISTQLSISFAKYYNLLNKPRQALDYAQRSLELAKKIKQPELIHKAAFELSSANFSLGKYKEAYQSYVLFKQIGDSLNNNEQQKKALQKDFQYKVQQQNLEQEKKDLVHKAEIRFQRIFLYVLLLGFLLVSGFAFFVFFAYQTKKRDNYALAEQQQKILLQNEELQQNQEEIETQRDLVAYQNNELYETKQKIAEQNTKLKITNEELEKEVKRRTRELLESNNELIQYNHQLEQFSFITAHNLRSPVARILGLASIFDLENPEIEEHRFLLQKLVESAQDLDGIIRDLNQILEIKKGTNMTFEKLSLSEILADTQKNLKEVIESSGAEIKSNFTKAEFVFSLSAYLKSIFYNLIHNALKYQSPERKALISIESYNNDSHICISIKDNGLGIDLPKYKEKLFGLYRRFHDHVEGKGLGLYMVKTQVEALGGNIEVESKPNEGTTFFIYLKNKEA